MNQSIGAVPSTFYFFQILRSLYSRNISFEILDCQLPRISNPSVWWKLGGKIVIFKLKSELGTLSTKISEKCPCQKGWIWRFDFHTLSDLEPCTIWPCNGNHTCGISHNLRICWRSPARKLCFIWLQAEIDGVWTKGRPWHRFSPRKRKPLESYEDSISWSCYWNEHLLMLLPRLMKERRSRNLEKKRIPHFPDSIVSPLDPGWESHGNLCRNFRSQAWLPFLDEMSMQRRLWALWQLLLGVPGCRP